MKKRKILIFAHVPPPHHGQSVMVQLLLEGLRADERFEVHHVDARVSDDLEDVGSFRPHKFIRLFKCIFQAWRLRLRYGRMAFYYVPAPAKKSAIMRDWVVMALCRPLFPELILHWHAYGLGEWVTAGNDWQRKLTRWALGKASLSIVLNNYNRLDAEAFAPQCIEVVPNGIADQFPDYETALAPRREARTATLKALQETVEVEWEGEKVGGCVGGNVEKLERVRFLFLGHLIETKGVFVAIEAMVMANNELCRIGAPWRLELVLAGSFVSEAEKARILEAIQGANKSCGNEELCVKLVGFLNSRQKKSALEKADGLIFPTFYENEAQPLVLFEAMCAGLPVVTTSWRGIAETLPLGYPLIVKPRSVGLLAAVLVDLGALTSAPCLRTKYEREYKPQFFSPRIADIIIGEIF